MYATLEESSSEFSIGQYNRKSSEDLFVNTNNKSGELTILRGMKGWKKMWFMIRGDTLFIFKEKNDPTVHKKILLTGAKIEEDLKVKRSHTIHIETEAPKKKHYCISCESNSQVNEWISALQVAAGPTATTGWGFVPRTSSDALPEASDESTQASDARKQKRRTARF
mmetsp:Transcript_29250/g.41169  ORF Transcript_29250/g.41169 Transcript_29250/m.41169 type:complete len:167 (+) Transcript_29250:173-673(+)